MQKRHYQSLAVLIALGAAVGVQAQDGEITSSFFEEEGPEFIVMGFGEVSYVSKDDSNADGFGIGQVVAHIGASMGDSFSVFGEFTATANNDSHSTGIERLIVKYDFSDRYKLSAGRYHTPIGYWNSGFHHGSWLQTTVSRPEMVKFGSKIVPIHFVGALLEGLIPSGKLGLDYRLGYGNGRHSNIAAAGDAHDINSDKAWMVQVNAKPAGIYGLRTGLGFYSDEVPLLNGSDVKENTVSAYAVWTKEDPEVIIEYTHSEHEMTNDSSVNGDVDAWYAQFGYRLPGRHSQWKPYARFERTRVDDSDPLLGTEALDYDGSIVGVRWDFNSMRRSKSNIETKNLITLGEKIIFRVQVSFALAKL